MDNDDPLGLVNSVKKMQKKSAELQELIKQLQTTVEDLTYVDNCLKRNVPAIEKLNLVNQRSYLNMVSNRHFIIMSETMRDALQERVENLMKLIETVKAEL